MPPKFQGILIGIIVWLLSTGGALFSGYKYGSSVTETKWTANTESEKRKAVESALEIERAQQKEVNDAIRKENEEKDAINSRLAADLERLRKRPKRPAAVPQAARDSCQGANGPELGAEHAEFLRRYSAAAARQDAALASCHQSYDALAKGNGR